MADLAIGVSKIEIGDVGNGIPGASLSALTENIALGSVNFGFNEPSETKIEAEDIDDPVAVITSKGDPDYIEFALISPSAATMVSLVGGSASDEKWEAPSTLADIPQTVKITTSTYDSKYYEYTIVNGKVVARLSQAPGKTQEEQLLVRVYIQQAKTDDGTVNTPFIREQQEE